METIKKTVLFLLLTACTLFFIQCSQEQAAPLNPETSVMADVVWRSQGIELNPAAVEFVRITVTSSCDKPTTNVFPYSMSSVAAAMVTTGCVFSILFEGLGFNNLLLYKGEVLNIPATGPTASVAITADACTPTPPDSLKAAPAGRKIILSWVNRANNQAGYIIKRAFWSNKNHLILDTVTECHYIDTFSITRQGPYYYQVYSYNAIGISTIAATIDSFTLSKNTRPFFISDTTDMNSVAVIGIPYIDTVRFADDDPGDSLSLSLFSAPKGATLQDSIITWLPDSSQADSLCTIVTIVSDQDDAKDTLIWSVNVTTLALISLPPEFSVNELSLNAAVTLGSEYIDSLKATDPENQPLTYRLLTAPTSATIDSSLGIVRWVADSLYKINFTAIVSDNTDKSDTVSWSVTVSSE
ncbi:MAG: hypothetical protein JW915_07430 [Chitinispirillaceae bacterium]|nr:hypothetical protein [Chitinispirillaceae bacterium]